MEHIYLTLVLSPLFGAILAGLWRNQLGRSGSHWVTISGVAVSCGLSLYVLSQFITGHTSTYNETLYIWMQIGGLKLEVGFLVDTLTALMISVVTFVSLMVHIYTVGYMRDEAGYQRFFSYISLFTFSMLMLVMANNFMQLFFGWEAVGLVSYLLIGFYFKKETAIFANMKAFLVNRVGDFGFILGIAAIASTFGSLDYATVFAHSGEFKSATITLWGDHTFSLITVICIFLFIGAMGKSAQMPLHVWLPDSMEGPTPISALIHAATMVTAGIFMVARMSPLFELSETALSFVLIIGATTAFFTGLIGIVQNDIKRVVAYSTLSQLGYMVVALGVSAYAAGVFHLMTHAFFKALLFLAAGSVIIGMHHDQDIRNMGGISKYMKITWFTALIGSLSLIGFPGFSGFFSKDLIIEAVHHSHIYGSSYAYVMVVAGVFVTALYSFRMYFLVFHGAGPRDEQAKEHIKESPWVVTLPLVLLAVPSVFIGGLTISQMIFGDWFNGVIFVLPEHDVIAHIGENFHGATAFVLHGVMGLPTLLWSAGIITAWYFCLKNPKAAFDFKTRFDLPYFVLKKKYGFDELFQFIFAKGALNVGKLCWKVGDRFIIEALFVNGSAWVVNSVASVARNIQTGYLYHYTIAMIVGLLGLMTWFVF